MEMNGNEPLSTTPKKESNSAAVTSKCSCPECDSIDCFIARNTNKQCFCVQCKNSKTCFFYSNRVNVDEKSSEINIALETSSLVNIKKNVKTDHIENEVIHDKNNMKPNSVPEERSKYSDTIIVCKSEVHDEYEKDKRSYTDVQNARVKFSRTTLNPATADLSAQVMNVPYKELKYSLSVNNAHKGQMTKYDIITKIKEAYKACSCKVCECVIGKSQSRNESCKCKPCDCNECTTILSKFHTANYGAHFLPNNSCPCIRCNRSQCKGIVQKYNDSQICDFEPCDCIKCGESFNKLCSCQPCQCVQCNVMPVHLPKILIVAPVIEDDQRNMCQCSPCDCIECRYNNYQISSNLMHEMSTGINIRSLCHCEVCVNEACESVGSDSCNCQTSNRIIMKPVEKNVLDYDIRPISTRKHPWNRNNKQFTSKNDNNTIAMFATLPDQYSGKCDSIKEYSNCDNCTSLVCNYNENYIDSIKSSRLFKVPDFPHLKPETSKCSSSECKLHFNVTNDIENSCKFKAFQCLKFQSLTKNYIYKKDDSVKLSSKLSSEGICKNRSDTCALCRKLKDTQGHTTDTQNEYEIILCTSYSSEDCYPIKRAKLLTPSILNGIECENMDSSNDSTSSNLDNSLKMKKLPLRKFLTDIKNQSHKDVLIHDTFQKSYLDIRAEQQENYDSSLNSGISSVTCISDVKKSNTEKDVDTDLNNLEVSFGDLYNNIVDNKQTLYNRIKNENKTQHNDVFKGKSRINDVLCNYNITRLNKSTTNYNKHIDLSKPQCNEEYIQVNTIDDNIYIQDIRNEMHVNKYMLSDDCNNTATKQSHGIILSDPQFNLNRDHDEEMEHIFPDSIKNKDYSVIDGEQLVNTLKNNTNLLNLHINYEKAQKTLNEAKIYSMHLLEILDKYEKANTTFQSTSQKLKASRDLLSDESIKFALGLLNESKLKNNENMVSNIQIIDEPKDYTLKSLANQININTTTRKSQLEPMKLEKEDDLRLPSKVIQIPDIESQKAMSMDLSKDLKQQDIYLTQNKNEPDTRNNSATMIPYANNTYLNSHHKIQAKVTCHKNNYNKLLKRARILSKKNSSPQNTRRNAKHISSQTENNFKNSINKEESLSRNTSITCNKELIEDSNESTKFNLTNIPSTKGTVSTTCFKTEENGKAKVLDIAETTKEMNYQDIGISPASLDIEVKQAFQSTCIIYISKQLQYENPEIKRLINSKNTVVTTVVRKSRVKYTETSVGTDCRMSLIQSTKSNCDALKVNFLDLKRVSDHTVLVRWNSPRDTTDIHGYEVDGRTVQKILNPTRNIAVVTCLPHCDKLLLTVKTITSVVTGLDHYPSVTVIYHPRKKKT